MADDRGWSYFFIDLVRRRVNDRIWFGMGLMAVGFGNLATDDFLPTALLVAVGVTGMTWVAWGWVRR